MSSHHALRIRRKHHRYSPWLELMEDRQLLSGTPALLDPLTVPKFVNPLPQPLDPSFVYQPTNPGDGTPHYEVGAYQIQEDLGLGLKDAGGNPVKTTVYGYGASADDGDLPRADLRGSAGSADRGALDQRLDLHPAHPAGRPDRARPEFRRRTAIRTTRSTPPRTW